MNDLQHGPRGQTLQHEPLKGGQHASWIAGRVQVLLSHYFQPDSPMDVMEMAIDDWIEALAPFSQDVIENACRMYLRNQPRRRPTPGDVRAMCVGNDRKTGRGVKSDLTRDELELLETKVLPTARRWLSNPGLADHAKQTLAYWGESA